MALLCKKGVNPGNAYVEIFIYLENENTKFKVILKNSWTSVNVIKDSNLKNKATGERLCLKTVLAMHTGGANTSPLGKMGCRSEGK